MKVLKWIQKNLIIVIPITMVMGLISGYYGDLSFLKSAILPLTFLMVYPMMINLPLKKIVERGDGKVQLAAQVINFGIIPFIALGLGKLFFPGNDYLILGLLLTGLLPTSGMTISWTGMAKGNVAAAVKMTVFGLILGSILTPLYITGLMGTTVAVNIWSIFKQIIIVIVVPLVLGNITQRLLIGKFGQEKYQRDIKGKIPPFSTLGVVGIVFVAMALKAKGIAANPGIILNILAPLISLYIINFTISLIAGKLFFQRENAIALLYGTVLRNLSIALAIAMGSFGSSGADIAIVIAVGYIIQIQIAAWAVKLTGKLFGSQKEALAEQ